MSIGDTCTLIYGLPYPTGKSNPCNIGSTGCDFAEAVEVQLDVLDGYVNQFQDIPFAYASNLAELNYDNSMPGNFVPFFDTTLADTDNMIDLSANPGVITIQTPGVYSFFVDFEMSLPFTGTSAILQMNISNSSGGFISGAGFTIPRIPTSPSMPLRVDGTRTANVCCTFEWESDCQQGYTCSFLLFVGGSLGTISNIQVFRAGAVWLRSSL